MATAEEKQRDVQEEIWAWPNDGFQRLKRVCISDPNFTVQFEGIDEAGKRRTMETKGRVTGQVKGDWEVLLPASVIDTAITRCTAGELESSRENNESSKAHLKRLETSIRGTPSNPKDGVLASGKDAWLGGNFAAIVLSAATATRLLSITPFTDFLVKYDGVFVKLQRPSPYSQKSTEPVSRERQRASTTGLAELLQRSSCLVLEGVPGTGKTHAITDLRGELTTGSNRTVTLAVDCIRFMTMHPSTSYEDFVEGLRPTGSWENSVSELGISSEHPGPWFCEDPSFSLPESSTKIPVDFARPETAAFAVKNGFFVEACVQAVENPDTAVVVVLDELNRCNIPKVLGDLMTVIEESKRAVWSDVDEVWQVDGTAKAVTLPYSGRKLFVPDNLFIVGTMNTTDRSVAPMDAALRRRFSFHRIWPDGFLASNSSPALSDLAEKLREPAIAPHTELWLALNRVLCAKFGADAMLGHSYLYDLRTALARDSKLAPHHWDHRILPQLMDVIESNGLTRLLVKDEAKFFDREKALPGRDLITKHIQVTFSGEGSLKKPHLKYLGSTNP